MKDMKQVFETMLDDPALPPLRDSAEVIAAARRSALRDIGFRAGAAALATAAVVGSFALFTNDTRQSRLPLAVPSDTASPTVSSPPLHLAAADWLGKWGTPSPQQSRSRRIVWIVENKAGSGYDFWYADALKPVDDPCAFPPAYIGPPPTDTCAKLDTPEGEVWVIRRPSAVNSKDSLVMAIYVRVDENTAILYSASSDRAAMGAPFDISNAEIAEIAKRAKELARLPGFGD